MKDQRRTPFAYQELPSTALIRGAFAGQQRMAALAIYQSMTEIANDFRGREFEAPRKAIAELAGCSPDTIDRYAERFIELGLLDRERRVEGDVHLPNVWSLLTPGGSRTSAATPRTCAPTPSRTSAATRRTGAQRGSRTSAATSRAHVNRGQEVKPQEEQEGTARARDANSIKQAWAVHNTLEDPERSVLGHLTILASARDLTAGWSAEDLLAIAGDFADRDGVREAERFRSYYAPGGLGENATFTGAQLPGIWRRWLERAPSRSSITTASRRRGGRRATAANLAEQCGKERHLQERAHWLLWAREHMPDCDAETVAHVIYMGGARPGDPINAAAVRDRIRELYQDEQEDAAA